MSTFPGQLGMQMKPGEGYYEDSYYPISMASHAIAPAEICDRIGRLIHEYCMKFPREPYWHKSTPEQLVALLSQAIASGTPLPEVHPPSVPANRQG